MNGGNRNEVPPPVLVVATDDAVDGSTEVIASGDISYAATSALINSLGTQPRGFFLPVASAQTQPGSPSNSKAEVALP